MLQRLRVRLGYALATARGKGIGWTISEIASRTLSWLFWFLLLPLTIVFHFLGYRRLPVITGRIGHLSAEIDCFLKLVELGEIDQRGRHYFILAPSDKSANPCLLSYWEDRVPIIRNSLLCRLISLMARGPIMAHDISDYVLSIGESAKYYLTNAAWADRPPLLTLNERHMEIGQAGLEAMGLPGNAWYVCIHAREGGYSPNDELVHDYRNVAIESLYPAMDEIVSRGGWCIRVGDPSMKPISKMDRVVDYAHHPIRSPEMDIFLCATCRFFLGNTSGLFIVSSVFGVPTALTNMVPMVTLGFTDKDLMIFKLIREKESQRILTAKEVMNSDIVDYRMSAAYECRGLELVDNTGEEIQELVVEMFDRLEGGFVESDVEKRLSQNFFSLVKPHHYCYGAMSKLSSKFLIRHQELFGI